MGGVVLYAFYVFIVATILPSIAEDLGGLALYAWSQRRSWSDRRRAPLLAPPCYRAADCLAHTASPPARVGFWLFSLFIAAPLAALLVTRRVLVGTHPTSDR